jgi:IrrE N-terminal-like domain
VNEAWQKEARLTRVARAAGYERTSVFISEQPTNSQPEGSHRYSGFGGRWDVDVFVASWLGDAQAEGTVLHELAHVELGHDDIPAFEAAEAADRMAGVDRARGPWEIEADALAAAVAEDIADELTDFEASLMWLVEDADRFG